MTVGGSGVCVCGPPQVQPVSVDLMIGQENNAIREIDTERTVRLLLKLTSDALVTTNSNKGWTPPLSHRGHKKAKVLLGERHVGVEVILGEEVERSS